MELITEEELEDLKKVAKISKSKRLIISFYSDGSFDVIKSERFERKS